MTNHSSPPTSFHIDTNYASYTIVRSPLRDVEQIQRETRGSELRYIRESLEDVERGNGWASRNVRQYAMDILKQKSFRLTHPKTGKSLRLGATYTFADAQTIFFFFGDDSLVGVVASDLATGFPLSSVILFNDKLIIHLTESFWGLRDLHFEALAANGVETIREVSGDCSICLVAGDQNFAHHAWNELSSLQEIAATGLDQTTSLAVFHEPLGPVNAVLGSAFEVVSKLPRARTPEINGTHALTFCSTGSFIDRQLVDKIVAFADQNLSPFALEVRDQVMGHRSRSLWISVRTRNRTISNQVEVLTEIIRAYLHDRPDRMVVIDGHSLPFDHDDDAHWVRDLNNEIVIEDNGVADQVIAGVKAAVPNANVVRFVGQKVYESIAVARHAGLYFCHHGTVQHKVGWFSSVEGLVHCNRDVLERRPGGWVKQQSEVAATPVYVPVDLIDERQAEQEMGELQAHLHHNNYWISDVRRAARLVSDFADRVERSS